MHIWNSQDATAGEELVALSASPSQQPHEFVQDQVLSLSALAKKGEDLIGTRAVSDKKIALFGGQLMRRRAYPAQLRQ